MEERMNIFKDRDVLVVGLARSGAGAASLLSVLGSRVTVTDRKSADSLARQIEKLPQQVRVVAGGNPAELFGSADLIVVSPGVPLDIPPLKHAREKGVPVIAELELAYQALRSDDLRGGQLFSPSVQFIGITGTNGKSTTTTLVDLMMKRSGYRTLLGGNIGNALTDEIFTRIRDAVPGPAVDHIVAEISSFQLEATEMFRPSVAAILNITPDHLDRYDSMEDYSNAKAAIFKNQLAGDRLILNAD
ncbi:MAG: Mur ligase family protein, partial [Nitrospirota bacterium]|nr:Mur ligase family protein [Nitrospirota bacterium]